MQITFVLNKLLIGKFCVGYWPIRANGQARLFIFVKNFHMCEIENMWVRRMLASQKCNHVEILIDNMDIALILSAKLPKDTKSQSTQWERRRDSQTKSHTQAYTRRKREWNDTGKEITVVRLMTLMLWPWLCADKEWKIGNYLFASAGHLFF